MFHTITTHTKHIWYGSIDLILTRLHLRLNAKEGYMKVKYTN